MTQPGEIQQKVQRLDSDVQAIYELLGAIRKGQEQQDRVPESHRDDMRRISATQQRQYTRLEEIGFDMERLRNQMGEIQATQHRRGNRLDGIDTKLDKMDGQLGTIVAYLETEPARQ